MTNVAAGPRINAKDNDCGDEQAGRRAAQIACPASR